MQFRKDKATIIIKIVPIKELLFQHNGNTDACNEGSLKIAH